ncbi:MAG: DMT family transporter [Mycobacteriaceae bacterium]|uniref:DMT family transporter n=1 Tax=Corynebacterium sp. TaxID=1720 RepID=UPI003F94A5CE
MTDVHGTGDVWRARAHLVATVVLEVIGTLALNESEGFTRPVPAVLAVVCYLLTVVALSLALKVLPMSLVYIIWTGAGTTGVVLFSVWLFGETMTRGAWLGLILVICGVMMINARRRTPEDHATQQEHPE